MADRDRLVVYVIGQIAVQINDQVIGEKDDQGHWKGETYTVCLNRLQQEGWILTGFERSDGGVGAFILKHR